MFTVAMNSDVPDVHFNVFFNYFFTSQNFPYMIAIIHIVSVYCSTSSFNNKCNNHCIHF